MDAYEILCIDKTASEEEIKSKFNDLLEEYTKTQDEATKPKIEALNAAYDLVINGEKYKEIRSLIENNNFIEAGEKLNIINNISSAEWNYLQGFLSIQKGWFENGLNYLKKSVEIDPNNIEYLTSLNKLQTRAIEYATKYIKQNANANSSNNMNACGGDSNGNKNGGLC